MNNLPRGKGPWFYTKDTIWIGICMDMDFFLIFYFFPPKVVPMEANELLLNWHCHLPYYLDGR